jgi:hypothetical protein
VTPLDADRRRALRAALIARYGWIDHDDVGPRAVEAGECDRCGREPRMVTTCGPTRWSGLGRACALDVGQPAWCDGHADQAAGWLAQLAALPDEADVVARLWWVATGEVRLDPAAVDPLLRTALPDETRSQASAVERTQAQAGVSGTRPGTIRR